MDVRIEDVLVKPVETEKTVSMVGKFAFQIHPQASKSDVRSAVKKFYGVDVEKVTVINLPAKTRMIGRGRTMTRRSEFRKAIVTLKEGQTLNFNDFK